MTAAQTALYFREWGRVRAHLIAKGIDPKQADHKRHDLHRRALGVDKSSKAFTNADLDKVLAAFRAITRPGDLTAQLRALDQPDQRREACWQKVWEIMEELRLGVDRCRDEDPASELLGIRQAYVAGIIRRTVPGKVRWDQLTDREAAQILGIMQRRQLYQRRARSRLAAAQDQVRGEVPF